MSDVEDLEIILREGEKVDEISSKPRGHPLRVVTPGEDQTFDLDIDALESILLQPKVRDKPVVVVCVAGAFRKGKSFLLDFFLRYLQSEGDADWLGSETDPLTGFHWRGGSERDTTGIVMWSEVFLVPRGPKKDPIAVILLDTQGSFDSRSTVKECATIFALSTMISSIQVYNLSQNIQEDDLQHLQLFTEYGKLALENTGETPFQNLTFLVRDWSYPYEYEYGLKGGMQLLQNRLEVSDKQHQELIALRKHIGSCFGHMDCFLLPHPGMKVATDAKFTGCIRDMEPTFVTSLKQLVPHLLKPEHLIVKQIGGQLVTCESLLNLFKVFSDIFKKGELPEPKTMLEATAEANNLNAVSIARDLYNRVMDEVSGKDAGFLPTRELEDAHHKTRDRALELFKSTRKMGGESFSEKYLSVLENDIKEAYVRYKTANESKNIFKSAKTPAVLVMVSFIVYILSTIFGLTGLTSLVALANVLLGLCFLALIFWAYSRYSGEHRGLATTIDNATAGLWDNIFRPSVDRCVSPESIQQIQRQFSAVAVRSVGLDTGVAEQKKKK